MQVYKGLEEPRGWRSCSGRRFTEALLGEGEVTGRGDSRYRALSMQVWSSKKPVEKEECYLLQ